ncbi:MAG: hypothetical protein ACTSXQ_06975 [Alphaproteobacteria bacterium]
MYKQKKTRFLISLSFLCCVSLSSTTAQAAWSASERISLDDEPAYEYVDDEGYIIEDDVSQADDADSYEADDVDYEYTADPSYDADALGAVEGDYLEEEYYDSEDDDTAY